MSSWYSRVHEGTRSCGACGSSFAGAGSYCSSCIRDSKEENVEHDEECECDNCTRWECPICGSPRCRGYCV